MSSARRFALIAPNSHPRTCGISDHTVRLAAELARRGHAVRIFSRDPVEPNPLDPSIEVVGVPDRGPIAIARALWPLVRGWAPTDVIIQYAPQMWDAGRFGSPAVPWLAAVAKRSGARVTLICHELFLDFQRRPDLFAGAALMRAQLAALLLTVDRSFVTTESRLSFIAPFCRALRLPAPGVVRIGPSALPVPLNPVPGRARLGIFSSAAVGKRFDVVLEAFARVVAAKPQAELVLIGDLGRPSSRRVREVTEAVRAQPAAARIRLTGKLSLDDVAREISNLDVYLFPMNTGANTRSSTLPVALAAHVPVVSIAGAETDRALFKGDENIVLADALTGPAFAAAALRILDDPALAARVAAGAGALYDEHLAWPRIVDRFLEAIG